MVAWSDVGNWLKDNSGAGTALIGSLITGNVPGAVAAGMSLVSSATGTDDPATALKSLQKNPECMIELERLAVQERDNIRAHTQEMYRLKLDSEQKEHETTQKTIVSGDNADDKLVRRTRPLQSWVALISSIAYVFVNNDPDIYILGLFLTLVFGYHGLRGADKVTSMIGSVKLKK